MKLNWKATVKHRVPHVTRRMFAKFHASHWSGKLPSQTVPPYTY